MNNALKIALGLFVVTLLAAIVISFMGTQPTDWRETYNYKHKKPFGTYIVHNELNTLFPKQEITTISKNTYNYFDTSYNYDNNTYELDGNYIYINNNMRTIDNDTSKEILGFVAQGNTAFIASTAFEEVLMDSLNFGYSYQNIKIDPSNPSHTKAEISIGHSEINEKKYDYSKNISTSYIEYSDEQNTTILGSQKINDTVRPNFIKVKYKKGLFYLHTQPIVFTNYHLLNGNQTYVTKVFSYLKDAPLHWDTHYYYNRGNNDNKKSSLSYFLSHKALKWAFLLGLMSIIFFILFNTKRKQRIIPVIKPLQNTTIDFTQTIGNLYFQQNNHTDIVQRKIIFFLEKIRNDYLIDTQNLNDDFIEKLTFKSGKKYGEVKLLINTVLKLNSKYTCTEDDLLRLNQLIEKFFNAK